MPASLSDLVALYRSRGHDRQGLAPVSQIQHALLAAGQARCMGLPPELTAACLLHDVGHLLDGAGDGDHGIRGAAWLADFLPPAVTGPIALHVPAKRWLCATERGYQAKLAESSRRSLVLQGGAMTSAEAAGFLALPHAPAAVAVRRVDDRARDAKAQTPLLDEFLPLLVRLSNVRTTSRSVRAVA